MMNNKPFLLNTYSNRNEVIINYLDELGSMVNKTY